MDEECEEYLRLYCPSPSASISTTAEFEVIEKKDMCTSLGGEPTIPKSRAPKALHNDRPRMNNVRAFWLKKFRLYLKDNFRRLAQVGRDYILHEFADAKPQFPEDRIRTLMKDPVFFEEIQRWYRLAGAEVLRRSTVQMCWYKDYENYFQGMLLLGGESSLDSQTKTDSLTTQHFSLDSAGEPRP